MKDRPIHDYAVPWSEKTILEVYMILSQAQIFSMERMMTSEHDVQHQSWTGDLQLYDSSTNNHVQELQVSSLRIT